MSGVLIVRPSSLGDIVYALALVDDIATHRPDLPIDWVAEEGLVPLVRLDPRIRNVVPLALRRWRRGPLASSAGRGLLELRSALRDVRYDAILNLQEQVKGSLVASLARGVRHGFDRASIREPVATWFDDVHHRVPRDWHFLDRSRRLAALALGYEATTPPRWRLAPPPPPSIMPDRPYVIVFHGTSRDEKLWPEERWRGLLEHFVHTGFDVLLSGGSPAEEARSARLAAGVPGVFAPPRQDIPALAALIEHAHLAVGVDTGFTHLAAVIGTPTIALFTVTDAAVHGVSRVGPHAVDIGGSGIVPALSDVVAAAGRLLAPTPRC
jgi:heptosyltransferase-1